MLAPERGHDVRAIVSATDFYRPAHAALFNAICHPPGGSAASSRPTAARILATITSAGADAAGITAVYAHTLITVCPHPAHATVYARMVTEASANRTVREHAVRLGQVARTDLKRGGVTSTLRHLDVLHATLDHLRTKHPLGNRRPVHLSPATPTPTNTTSDDATTSEETAVLRGLAADPSQFAAIEHWFCADDFTTARHSSLYTCLRDLHHRGDPIDPVTVLWQAHRRDHTTTANLTAEDINTLLNHGLGPSVAYEAKHVLRRALLRRTHHAADTIRHLATPQRHHPYDLAAAARHALTPADTTRQRWRTVTATPQSPTNTHLPHIPPARHTPAVASIQRR